MTGILKIIRLLFFSIDNIVYNFIPTIYDLLIDISRTSVLSQANILDMSGRIYKLLTVFMVFKVIFSLIMYVVNPDDFSDKAKGIGKLGTNIVISLSLLILTPYIFNYAYQLQTIVLQDNSLATLVFGEQSSKAQFNTAGQDMAYVALSPFLTPDVSISGIENCATLIDENGDFNSECSGLENDTELTPIANIKYGLAYLATYEKGAADKEKYLTYLRNYVTGVKYKSMPLMLRGDIINLTADVKGNSVFLFKYHFLFSTVVGIAIILLLITYCMDVAVRSIKLAFLQLVAPIPIISYIDPKSGKDGIFKKWYQMCFKTFLSLFIRLLALYFAIYIIGIVADLHLVDIIDGSYQSSAFVKIFVIIGALMFAKQLPKILEGLGIKLDGDGKFTLNPLKKFEDQALGGKRVTGLAGAAVAGTVDRTARVFTAAGTKGKLKALAGFAPGVLGSAARGFSGNAGFSGGMSRQAEFNRRLREGRRKGLSPMSSYLDYAGSRFGLDDATLEQEGTFLQRNKDEFERAKRMIAESTRGNELAIENEKRKLDPLKSVQSRRNNVKTAADKLKDSAESFASKKADFRKTALQQHQLDVIARAKNQGVASLAEADKAQLRAMGINLSASDSAREVELEKKRRELSRNQYTTNRRSDAANVEFLTNNQGKKLDHALIIGDKDFGQVVFEAGTYIDGDVVARAEAAKGKYIKVSQKAVYNELAKGMNSEYAVTAEDDYNSFQNDYDAYDEAKNTANGEISSYSGNNPYDITVGTIGIVGARSFDEVDSTSNTIKSGSDTTTITSKINESESEIQKRTSENEKIKANQMVDYINEKGEKIRMSLAEAESLSKPRDETYKRKSEQHQERRTLLQSMANKK